MPQNPHKVGRKKRLELIRKIEQKRNSKVITYITSDRHNLSVSIAEDVVGIIHEHLILSKVTKDTNIDLFLYSRGGDADVPWSLVSMIREYVTDGSFNVIIPYKAHSAATVISLGADEIIMSKKGELGPIDATIANGPYNPYIVDPNQKLPISVEDVKGYFTLYENFISNDQNHKIEAFKELTSKVSPLALGSVNRLLEQTKLVAKRLLETRKEKFESNKNDEIIKTISSEIYSHRHAINRTEAKNYLGLSNVKSTEELGIDTFVWDLYKEYSVLFEFDKPFAPELELNISQLDEKDYKNLNLACIESSKRYDVACQDLKVKRIKQTPPQVSINLNNLNFPPLNIPTSQNLKPNDINAAINQYINLILPAIINQSTEKIKLDLIKLMPDLGFQKIPLKSGWNKIISLT